MKHTLKKSAGLAAALVLLAGHASSAWAQDTLKISEGQRFYQKVCAKCHEAGTGPVILGRGLPEIAITTIARHGNNAMPAFRLSDIDDATLQDLAAYVSRSPAPKKP